MKAKKKYCPRKPNGDNWLEGCSGRIECHRNCSLAESKKPKLK